MKARTIVKWAIVAVTLVILVAICGVVWLFVAFYMDMEKGEKHRRQFQAELDSGRCDFGDQPALFAVAQAVVKNDPEAIRTAANGVPDLQAPGRDGATLLNFLFAFAPIGSVMLCAAIANAHGCKVDEGSAHPCIINGHDYGELLYSLGVMGWFMLVTIPGGLVAFVGWLIFFILHRSAWRKRISAGIPPPVPPPAATA